MKFSARFFITLAFLCKSDAYDKKGGVADIDENGGLISAISYEKVYQRKTQGKERIRRAFEEEKKHLDQEFEKAKSKGWYRKMKDLAIASVDVQKKLHQIQEDRHGRIHGLNMKMGLESKNKKYDFEAEKMKAKFMKCMMEKKDPEKCKLATPKSENQDGEGRMTNSGYKAVEKMNALKPIRHVASVDAWMVEMLNRVNQERTERGLTALCLNEKLNKAAENHNNDMFNKGIFSHTGSDGSNPADRIEKAGYNWGSYGENVAQGQTSVDKVMNAWMNSSGHKANILGAKFEHLGVAWETTKNHWTQVFASDWENDETCIGDTGGGNDGGGNDGGGSGGKCNDKSDHKKARSENQCQEICKESNKSYEYLGTKKCYCC